MLTFSGGQLQDAQEILFYDTGLEVTKLEPAAGSVKATVKVAPDCRLGEHVAQVRTATGLTEFRTFYVGALPAVVEKEPNSGFDAPQPIELGVTVTGVVQNEDVDYYQSRIDEMWEKWWLPGVIPLFNEAGEPKG